jgi:hypothetical protein
MWWDWRERLAQLVTEIYGVLAQVTVQVYDRNERR